ncbi:hypothetical protein [Microvirga massiliensis]|uniref:hypothetical protein n=1 Tax=Microvirga massiliensis TaxID=1033741 RepID=UPI00164E994D|nr:hypothetical protein [Microvirga massiliensis]
MPRELTDADGVTWSCAQAFAGLCNDPEKAEAARVEGSGDHFHVVCTPSGRAKSVRLELPSGWEESCTDEEILKAIQPSHSAEHFTIRVGVEVENTSAGSAIGDFNHLASHSRLHSARHHPVELRPRASRQELRFEAVLCPYL